MNNLAFGGMSLMFRIRDALKPRIMLLEEVGLLEGQTVLDFGCGPGSYVPGIASLVGDTGIVYALDRHPKAISAIQKLVDDLGLGNVRPIHADTHTGLPDESIDVVLLYDILHMLNDPDQILSELARVLKPAAKLSCHDPHMRKDECTSTVTKSGKFQLAGQGANTFTFRKRTVQ